MCSRHDAMQLDPPSQGSVALSACEGSSMKVTVKGGSLLR